MAIYIVTGKLGTGKSKLAVMRMRQAIWQRRTVVSNIDLNLEVMTKRRGAHYIRIPDKPSVADLDALPHGNPDSYDEDRNGLLVLDECGSWLNARQFADPSRQKVIDWLIHARKRGYDVLFLVQHFSMVDKQIRDGLAENIIVCHQLGRMKVPVIGGIANAVFGGRVGYLPRVHLAKTMLNLGGGQMLLTDRQFFKGDDVHKAYDTRQVFVESDARVFTALHPHRFVPPPPPRPSLWQRWRAFVEPRPRPKAKPKLAYVAAAMALPLEARIRVLRCLTDGVT